MAREIEFLDSVSAWRGVGVLSILGPTGSGKTKAALEWVDRHFPKEQNGTRSAPDVKKPLLVSVDAVAIFRGLDIGSAKPLGLEREGYDWAGIDLFSPNQKVSLGDFVDQVFPKIVQALKDSRPVLLVGGSHFYEQALIEGQAPGAASDPVFLQSLEALTNEELAKRLYTIDSRFEDLAHRNDRYRLTRYLDLAERQKLSFDVLTKQRLGGLKNRSDSEGTFPICRVALGLETSREENERRLLLRIHQMLTDGWVAEVRNLLHSGLSKDAPSLQSVGYREVLQFIDGEIEEKDLPSRILTSHLQLVKKQKTWIRGLIKKTGASRT